MNSQDSNEEEKVTAADSASATEEAPKRPAIKVRRSAGVDPLPAPASVAAKPAEEPAPVAEETPAPAAKPKPPTVGVKAAGASRPPVPAAAIKPKAKPAPAPAQVVPQRPKPTPVAKPKATPPGLTMPASALEQGASVFSTATPETQDAPPTTSTPSVEMDTVTAVKSKYYQDVVVDPVSGTHFDLVTSQALPSLNPNRHADDDEDDEPAEWDYPKRVRWFLFIYAAMLVVTGAAAFFNQKPYWVSLFVCNLVTGVVMPTMKVVPWQDEDPDDVGWLLLGTLALGPVAAFCLYSVVSLLRRGTNYAIVGCLATSAISRIVVELSTGNPTMKYLLVPWTTSNTVPPAPVFYVSWAGLFTMLGWYLGNIFHKLDE